MNLERLNQAIAVMKRADKVDMNSWQAGASTITTTEKELHQCGNSACFAGWVAVSPEFQAAGGTVDGHGGPRFEGDRGSQAIVNWLEVNTQWKGHAIHLIVRGVYIAHAKEAKPLLSRMPFPVDVYEDPAVSLTRLEIIGWAEWSAKDVITALETLLND